MRAVTAPIRLLGAPIRAIRSPRAAVRWLVGLALLSVALGAGYQLWLRNSDLVAVREVTVRGASSSSAPEIRQALERAGRQMTTLNVSEEELERAVADHPVVRTVSARPSFPNGLQITVRERVPVAVAGAAGGDVALAADGVALRGIQVDAERLPALATGGSVRGARVAGRRAREGLKVLGEAPEPLRAETARISWSGPRGLVASARSGTKIVFGDARNARRKWQVVAALLGDPDLVSVSEIDVRVPDRPAVVGELTGEAQQLEQVLVPAEPDAADPSSVAAPATEGAPEEGAGPEPEGGVAAPPPEPQAPPPDPAPAPGGGGSAPSGGVPGP